MQGYSYGFLKNKLEELANYQLDKYEDIMTLLRSQTMGVDLGVPQLGKAPVNKYIAQAYKDMINGDVTADVKKDAQTVIEHLVGYFESSHSYMRSMCAKSLDILKECKEMKGNFTIYKRDFDKDPECAKIINALISRFDGKAKITDLKLVLPQFYDEMENMLDKCNALWKDIIEIDEQNGIVYLNGDDYNSYSALIENYLCEYEKKSAKLREEHELEHGQLYYVLEKFVPDGVRDFFLRKLSEHYSKPIVTYKSLFTQIWVNELKSCSIFTGLDFLKADLDFIKKNVSMNTIQISEAKLTIASRIKYDCLNFEIEIVHPSVDGDVTYASFVNAINEFKRYSNVDKITWGEILSTPEFILSAENVSYRRTVYKIIAFIRYFTNRCKNEDPFVFQAFGQRWRYSKYLTGPEQTNCKLKPEDYENNEENKENGIIPKSFLTPQNDQNPDIYESIKNKDDNKIIETIAILGHDGGEKIRK